MRILIFSSSYAPVIGGLQTVLSDLTQGLREKHDSILVVTNLYPRQLCIYNKVDGITVLRLPLLAMYNKILSTSSIRLVAYTFISYFSTLVLFLILLFYSPHIVNIHFPDHQLRFYARLRKLFRRYCVVTSLHGDDIQRYSSTRRYENEDIVCQFEHLRSLLADSEAVVVCSRYMHDEVLTHFPALKNIAVIANGVREPEVRNSKPTFTAVIQPPFILSYGRFTGKKGIDMLIKAYAAVAQQDRGIPPLVIAGSGPEETLLKTIAAESGVAQLVIFTGPLRRQEIFALLKICEFAIFPSRIEPFGVAALEAMSCGKPVLLTDVGGFAELGRDCELICANPSVDGLRDGIREMFAQRASWRVMGEHNRFCAAKYSVELFVSRYKSLFMDITSGQVTSSEC